MLFDIGANRGDACYAALRKGFDKVIALEPAPRIYRELVKNFIYSPVVPIKMAVSNTNNECVEFYEAEEDGLSTLNKNWLTADNLPYKGKPFRSVKANTITVDTLAEIYGEPDLMKIDVEGAEWSVFKGMTKYHGMLCFEWTDVTLEEHEAQLLYLQTLGYTEYAPQFIVDHLEAPDTWRPLNEPWDDAPANRPQLLGQWVAKHAQEWKETGWKKAGLRPTSDVGMCWVR